MSIANIVSDFELLGVYLWAENEQLKFKAPAGVLQESHKQRLKTHKSELIEFLSDPVVDAIIPDNENRYESFPLTDLQLAYLVGRTNAIEYGGVGCHSYIELDLPPTDFDRLQNAWHQLVNRHDMLRAVISQEGYQQILQHVAPPPVSHHDFCQYSEEQSEESMLQLRQNLAHRHYQPDQWPQYEMHLTSVTGGAVLHFSIDLLIADFASIQILLAELGELYNHSERELKPLQISYRDVVLARQSMQKNAKAAARYAKHKAYWLERIKQMPMPPELPMAPHEKNGRTEGVEPVTFDRHHFSLSKALWSSLKQKANAHKITPSSVVLAAFTEVIGRWSRHRHFCLNLTMLNRSTAHPDIRGVVGDFIAVNVSGVTPDLQQNFTQRAKAQQQQLWRDLEHGDFSGIEVLREMSQQQQSNVIVPIVYTSTVGLSGDELDANEFMHQAKLRYGITQTPQVWLDCQATERDDVLIVDWDVRQGIFQDGVIEQAHAAFCELLKQLADDDQIWSSNEPVPLSEQTLNIRRKINDTSTEVSEDHLHSCFCRHALAQPEATAVISDNQQLSYAELASQAIAFRDLIQPWVQPGDRVAIVMDKTIAQIAAVLGVLLADATYVPIEGAQPVVRRNGILLDAGVKVVLSETRYLATDWPDKLKIFTAEQTATFDSEYVQRELRASIEAQKVAAASTSDKVGYIIYTSGTTGEPKGVMMSHRAALNTVADINQRFNVGVSDRVLGLVSFGFDLSIWDIFGTLGAGATLVLPSEAQRADPAQWAQLMEQHKVTIWNSVPAQMQMLVTQLEWLPDIQLQSLRFAMLSGDWIPVSLPDALRSRCPWAKVISLGGPTETAIWCVCYPIGKVDEKASSIPYGLPLDNHRIYILNEFMEPCPDWVTGEMYIGGAGLAKGYAGDPLKTTERFILHPVSGERLYRSGDLGRHRPDGLIEIQGRDDGQVKINGHRIEQGEIEAAICAHPEVKSAAVVTVGNPPLLAAAVVPSEYDVINNSDLALQITNHLEQMLPAYMIPPNLTVLSDLPLSSNSKIDRKKLKQILSQPGDEIEKFEAPLETALEQQVATIWRELLQIEQLSRHHDFFQIGGSSLTAVNLLSAYLAQGYSADIDLIFNYPVFADMVMALEQSNAARLAWVDSIDLQQMAQQALVNLKVAEPFKGQEKVKTVLLTGATGYLGSYLINCLLQQTNYHIYCLLRCTDAANGLDRLAASAREKGLPEKGKAWQPDLSRLTVIPGELDKASFGLGEKHYRLLSEQVDFIIHNASIINLMDPLSGLYPTNVEGVVNIIKLASTARVKPVHYISTIGIHHALPEDVPQPVVEQTPAQDWRSVELTYEQSKMMAETLFNTARENGLPVNILRPGTITWETGDKPYINDDAFIKFFRACLNIQAYPASELAVNIVPVDHVAKYITAIASTETGKSLNFHLVSQESSAVETMYQWFNSLGCDFRALDFEDWKNKLDDNFVRSFVNLYFKNGMDGGGHHQYCTENLNRVLTVQGIEGFKVDQNYLRSLIERYSPNSSRRGV